MIAPTEPAPGPVAPTTQRDAVLVAVAAAIAAIRCDHPVRVAVDGVDAAGKTTFANALAAALRTLFDRTVVCASIDGFHNPRSVRLARGPDAPEGYYHDSFDLDALMRELLHPLGVGGNGRIRRRVFDYLADEPVASAEEPVGADAILLFDGVFLLRPELRPCWEFSVFLDVPFDITVERAVARDGHLFGDAVQVRRRYARRYVPGQELYLAAVHPQAHASVVIDNSDFERPVLVGQTWPLPFTQA